EGLFAGWTLGFNGQAVIGPFLRANHGAIYGSLASIFGSLLGFSITALSIIVGLSGIPQLAVVRESPHFSILFRVFFSTIRWLGLATVAALAGVLVNGDCDRTGGWILQLNVFTTAISILRIFRSVWVLEYIVSIVARRSGSSQPNP